MTSAPTPRQILLFAVMSGVWGMTWIAIKTGVEAVPPLFFAAARFLAAGVVLLALARPAGLRPWLAGNFGRLVLVALLVNTAAYAFLFWGVQHVPSGLAAVVNLALMPVALFAFGLAFGEERYALRKVLGIALGVAGLAVLFWPRLAGQTDGASLTGLAAIVAGTLSYCLGSVLSRPMLRDMGPLTLAGLHMLIGGAGLAILSRVLEPTPPGLGATFVEPAVLASWLFLVLAGAVVGFTIYLSLLRDWGPGGAGLYAFVSPVIAVVLGVVVLAEPFGGFEAVGALIMLSAAALTMGARVPLRHLMGRRAPDPRVPR